MNVGARAKRSFRIDDLLRKDENDNTIIPERRNEETLSRRFNIEVPTTRPGGSSAIAGHSREQVISRSEIEVPRREKEPRREIGVPRQEIELPRQEIKVPRRHYSPQYDSDDEMATKVRHEHSPVLAPPPRRYTLPLQPAPLRALPISFLTYATGSPHMAAGAGWWRGAGRAGGQVRFSPSQTAALERLFAHHKYLTPDERRALAHQLGLTDRQVKTWFQNRRAKWRRGGDGDKYKSAPSSPNVDR